MRQLLVLLTIALISTNAHAYGGHNRSCGAEVSFDVSNGETRGLSGYDDSFVSDKFDNKRTNFFGIKLRIPLGNDDCEAVRASARANRAQARSTRS